MATASRGRDGGDGADPRELAALPRHVAVIMDGNGRWARSRGLNRLLGHDEGGKSVRELVRECSRLGIGELTLYAFSTENWRRPRFEVDALMRLLRRYLVDERDEVMRLGVRLRGIGRIEGLPAAVIRELEKTEALSRDNRRLTVRLALNYGGRAEIVDAARRIAVEAAAGRLDPAGLDEPAFRRYLYDPEMSDPDLLIRTGGEKRLSNFLLWEMSYSEIYLTATHWPDFRKAEFAEALRFFASRQRRFGGVEEEPRPRTRRAAGRRTAAPQR